MKKIIIVITALLFTSCAYLRPTPYQAYQWNGGYGDTKLNKDLYRVTFRGNGNTSEEAVHSFFLRRCAEITKNKGYQYFSFAEKNEDTHVQNLGTETKGNISKNPYNNTYNYSSTSSSNNVVRFRREGIIKLFKEGKQPTVSYNAADILEPFQNL